VGRVVEKMKTEAGQGFATGHIGERVWLWVFRWDMRTLMAVVGGRSIPLGIHRRVVGEGHLLEGQWVRPLRWDASLVERMSRASRMTISVRRYEPIGLLGRGRWLLLTKFAKSHP